MNAFPSTPVLIRMLRLGSLTTAVAMLAGCRSSASPSATQTTLVIAQGGDPGALNPAVTTSGNTHPVTDQIFNGLVGLDAELNPVPELAERWRIDEVGRTYRFTLRDGVRWHDGTPFTSGDVKFTFENALLKYHSRTRAALEGLLLGIDTPDQRTAVFRLKRPYSPLLQRLDVVEASIIPRHQYEGQDLLSGEPTRAPDRDWAISLRELRPGNNLVLERNPDYFRKGLPGVDRLVFRIFPNPAMSVAALERRVDYVGGIQELTLIDCARLPALPWLREPAAQGDRCARTS